MSIPDFIDAMVRLYNSISDEGKHDFFNALFVPPAKANNTNLHTHSLWFICLVYARARNSEKYPSLSWHISDEDSVQIQHAKEKQNLENAFQMRFDSSQFSMDAPTTRYTYHRLGGRVRLGGKEQPFKSYGDFGKFIDRRQKVFSKLANLGPEFSIQKAIERDTMVTFENNSFIGLENFCQTLSQQMKDFLIYWQENSITGPIQEIIKKHGTKIPTVFKMFFGNDKEQAAAALQEIHSQRQQQIDEDDREMSQGKKTTKNPQQKTPKPRGRPRKAVNDKKWQQRDDVEKKQVEALAKVFGQIPLSSQICDQSKVQPQPKFERQNNINNNNNKQTTEEQHIDENDHLIIENQKEDERQFLQTSTYNMEDSIDVTPSKRAPRQKQPQEQFPADSDDKPLSQRILNCYSQSSEIESSSTPDFLNFTTQIPASLQISKKNVTDQVAHTSQQLSIDSPATAPVGPKENQPSDTYNENQSPVNLGKVTDKIPKELPKDSDSSERTHANAPVEEWKKRPTKKSKKPEPQSSDDEALSSSPGLFESEREESSRKKIKGPSEGVQVTCTLTLEQLSTAYEFFKMVRDLQNYNMIEDPSQVIPMFRSLANTFLRTGNTDPMEFAKNTQIFWDSLPNAVSRVPSRAPSQHSSDIEQ